VLPAKVQPALWLLVCVLEHLLSAVPQLRVCETDLWINDADEARRALRI
jgi:hypothetical protein